MCLGTLAADCDLDWGMAAPKIQSTIRCPQCGVAAVETMPTNACVYFWDCPACGAVVKPRPGDCCVFCSYGSAPHCPPKQQAWSDAEEAHRIHEPGDDSERVANTKGRG